MPPVRQLVLDVEEKISSTSLPEAPVPLRSTRWRQSAKLHPLQGGLTPNPDDGSLSSGCWDGKLTRKKDKPRCDAHLSHTCVHYVPLCNEPTCFVVSCNCVAHVCQMKKKQKNLMCMMPSSPVFESPPGLSCQHVLRHVVQCVLDHWHWKSHFGMPPPPFSLHVPC